MGNLPLFHQHGHTYFQRAFWLKVFFHNFTGVVTFKDEAEAKHCNEAQKYSILDEIGPQYKYKGHYEFILEYPSLDYYFQWQQSLSPLEDIESIDKDKAEGFNLIHNGTNNYFGGLVKTNLTISKNNKINSLLNGYPGDSMWYFGIGMYSCVYEPYASEGPPPAQNPGTDLVVLWIRDPRRSFFCTMSYINIHYNHLCYLFVILK